jgi:hypothetical protein
MKNNTRVFLGLICSLALVTAVWAIPPATGNTNGTLTLEQTVPQTQSASGTISKVDKNSFTITLAPSGNVSARENLTQDSPKSMTFVVDQNTTIDGKLQVGSTADVVYRDDNGNHVAIGVRVTPPPQS